MTSAWGMVPFAVHVSDGVLAWPWLVGGFVVAGLLSMLAAYRVRDEEIPRIALMTAAFFVASLIHVKLGPTSVHLLLNGLLGVVLGRRAPLAVLVGVGLQAFLLGFLERREDCDCLLHLAYFQGRRLGPDDLRRKSLLEYVDPW